jgi:hypothetical protein
MVAEIFGEQFFASVWSGEARFDRYWGNRKSLSDYSYLTSISFLRIGFYVNS